MNYPNIGDIFWRDSNDDIGPSARFDESDFRCSREDIAIDVVDHPYNEQYLEDIVVETSEEEDELDGTNWDSMEEDD